MSVEVSLVRVVQVGLLVRSLSEELLDLLLDHILEQVLVVNDGRVAIGVGAELLRTDVPGIKDFSFSEWTTCVIG